MFTSASLIPSRYISVPVILRDPAHTRPIFSPPLLQVRDEFKDGHRDKLNPHVAPWQGKHGCQIYNIIHLSASVWNPKAMTCCAVKRTPQGCRNEPAFRIRVYLSKGLVMKSVTLFISLQDFRSYP